MRQFLSHSLLSQRLGLVHLVRTLIRRRRRIRATGAVAALLVCALPQLAEARFVGPATIIVGYGAGGGFDGAARLLAKHIGKYLPDNPTIVVQNMPGAGGLKAANYLASVARTDGSTIAIFSQQLVLDQLLGVSPLDFRKFSWIGSLTNEQKTCVMATSSPAASWQGMLDHEHVLGGQYQGSDQDTMTNLLQMLFDTKSKLVTGYNGTQQLMLAIERGEIEGYCGQAYGSFMRIYGNYLASGKIRFTVYASPKDMAKLPDAPNEHPGEPVPGGQVVGVIVAEQAMPVVEDFPALFLRLGVAALPADHPRHLVSGGQRVRVVVSEDPAPVGQDLAVHPLRLGVPAGHPDDARQAVAGRQRVGIGVAEQPALVGEDLAAQLFRLGVASLPADHPRQVAPRGQGLPVLGPSGGGRGATARCRAARPRRNGPAGRWRRPDRDGWPGCQGDRRPGPGTGRRAGHGRASRPRRCAPAA